MLYKVLWILAISAFLVSATFLGWLGDVRDLISTVNSIFWVKLPWEFQIIFFGFAVVVPTFLIIWAFS